MIQKLFVSEISNTSNNNNNSISNQLDTIVVTSTKDLQDYLVNTAQGINELVKIVGEDKVTAAIFVTQVLLQGTIATAKGLVSDEVNNYLTGGIKESLSEYIANKYFDINNSYWNESQQNSIINLSNASSGFAIDTLLAGGAFGIIKSANKLGSATQGFESSVNTNGNIFTQKTEYQATDKGTGNNYTVYQRSDIDLDLTLDNLNKINPQTGTYYTNREWMAKGNTPYVKDSSGNMIQLNLHHSQQQGSGPLFEITSTTHQNSTNQNALHPYGQEKNPNDPVDRTSFDKDRTQYWKDRLKQMEDGN
jgi:hypothetical protein